MTPQDEHAPKTNLPKADIDQMLPGGGEMGARIRSFDWSKTALGAFEAWSPSLKSAVSFLLPSKAQICLFWGAEFTTLYNDAYSVVLGSKHPEVLGTSGWVCWHEIWEDTLGPLLKGVVATGEAFSAQDFPVFLQRQGFPEETYFDVSYDPVREENASVGGVFCIVNETTKRVLSERRLKTLHRLGSHITEADSVKAVCDATIEVLSVNQSDVPFALIYVFDEAQLQAQLMCSTGIPAGSDIAPPVLGLSVDALWPLQQLLHDQQTLLIENLTTQFQHPPSGSWPEPPHSALLLPILSSGHVRPLGLLIAGVSSRLLLDDDYRSFYELVVGHIAAGINNARAHEVERKRVQALAELDRAKVEFFSNVSHEFRTPLTLLLNPLQEVLQGAQSLTPEQRDNLDIAQRNSLRLLKLVNTLLDYSRIQTNRIQAAFEPTDLATLTADLASNFRSVIERAGLRLTVACDPLPEPVYVDREMWEKIVLNLLSNAFKFTFEGEITVRLHATGHQVELNVQDTGIGIADSDQPHIFERFHRVQGARSRSHEGSGIGLALVAELVQFHGGHITFQSEVNRGTTFTVSIPFGTAHLPHDQMYKPPLLISTAIAATAYTAEASRWITEGQRDLDEDQLQQVRDYGASAQMSLTESADDIVVLVVDDNADMRDYLQRLLSSYYQVQTASDGLAALEMIRRHPPTLLIVDVMLPNLDGFALLARLRADPQTRTLPVILISARAGEEARIEGLQAGADDYLIKPFAARELLARVEAQLNLIRFRRSTAERDRFRLLLSDRLRSLNDPLEIQQQAAQVLGEYLHANRVLYAKIIGDEAIVHLDYADGLPSIKGWYQQVDFGLPVIEALRLGKTVIVDDTETHTGFGPPERAIYAALHIRSFVGVPLVKEGRWVAVLGVYTAEPRTWAQDEVALTEETAERTWSAVERAKAEATLRVSETTLRQTQARLAAALEAGLAGTFFWDLRQDRVITDDNMRRYFALPEAAIADGVPLHEVLAAVHEEDRSRVAQALSDAIKQTNAYQVEYRVRHEDGALRWLSARGVVERDEDGAAVVLPGFAVDITRVKTVEADLREAEKRLRELYQAETRARAIATLQAERLSRLQRITAQLSQSLTFEAVARSVIEESIRTLGASSGSLNLLGADRMFSVLYSSGSKMPSEERARWQRFPLDERLVAGQVILRREPLWWESAADYAEAYPAMQSVIEVYPGAWAVLPLLVEQQAIGVLGFTFDERRWFDQDERSFIMAIAQQCAQALKRAQLFEAEQQARQEAAQRAERLSKLQALTADLLPLLTFEQVVKLVVDVSVAALEATTGAFNLLEDEDTFAVIYSVGSKMPPAEREGWMRYLVELELPSKDVVRRREPVWLESVEEALTRYPAMKRIMELYPGAWVMLPLLVGDKMLGALGFAFHEDRQFAQEERDFMLTLAQICAQALERIRLHDQAQQLAAYQERQRLARELHDSVSQVLFSASIMAETLPQIWARDPERGKGQLTDILTYNRAALAEMRTLLLELRPESIARTPLPDLLEQQVRMLKGRKSIDVQFAVEGVEGPKSPEVHVAVYRIAQETLNNIVKHSQATQVSIQLATSATQVQLRISDNGRGFDLKRTTAGIGLNSIRERAQLIGALLELQSLSGKGTWLVLNWKATDAT